MKPLPVRSLRSAVALLILLVLAALIPNARARPTDTPAAPGSIHVSLIDQLSPQVNGPAFQGLDERRRGPIFQAALQQAVQAGKLPPVALVNRDLSIPATVADEPKPAPGTRLLRIYLTQWSQTPSGGTADTEILCRFFVELRRDGHVEKKLGPFFARKAVDTVAAATPQDRWAQYQAVAREAIEQMAAALPAPR